MYPLDEIERKSTMGFKQTRAMLRFLCVALFLTENACAKGVNSSQVLSEKRRKNQSRRKERGLGSDIFSMKNSKSEAYSVSYPQTAPSARMPTSSPQHPTPPPTSSPSRSPTKRPTSSAGTNTFYSTYGPTRAPSSGAGNTMTMTSAPSRVPTVTYLSGPTSPSTATPISPSAYVYDVEAYDENVSPSDRGKEDQNASVDNDDEGRREGAVKFLYFLLSVAILFCCCVCWCCVAAGFKTNGDQDDKDEKETVISDSTYHTMDRSMEPVSTVPNSVDQSSLSVYPLTRSSQDRISDCEIMVSPAASCDFSTTAEASESGSSVHFMSPVLTKSRSIDSTISASSNLSKKTSRHSALIDSTSEYSSNSAASASHISVALSRSRSRESTASSEKSADEFFSLQSRPPKAVASQKEAGLSQTPSKDSASCASVDRACRNQPIFRTFDDPSEHSAPTVMIVNRAPPRQAYNLQSMIDSVSSSSSSLGNPSDLFSGTHSVGSMSHESKVSHDGSKRSQSSFRSQGSKRSQSSRRSHGSKRSQSSRISIGSKGSHSSRKSRGNREQLDPIISYSRSNSSVSSSQCGPPLGAPSPDSDDDDDGGFNQPVNSKIIVQPDATSKVGALLTMPHPQDREIKPSRSFESYHRYRDDLLTSLRSRTNSWDDGEEDEGVDYVEY